MAMFKPIKTIKANIDLIPIRKGQFICCTDSNETFMDEEDERIKLGDIIILDTEDDRESIFIPLIDKLYVVKESNKLYRHNGSDWLCLSSNTSISLIKGTTIIRQSTDKVSINITGFDKTKDTIMVYINSVYLEEGTDYNIDSTSKNLLPIFGDIWEASEKDPSIFNFVVFKNIPCSNDSSLSIENHHENLEKSVYDLKKENAQLYYIMMINKMDLSGLLMYDKINHFYNNDMWDANMLSKALEMGVITIEQCNKIMK